MKRPATAFLLTALLCAPALAQDSDWDLERENARLRARLKLVEARLETLEHLVREQTMLLEELNAWTRRRDRPRREREPDRERAHDERVEGAEKHFNKLRVRLGVAAERLGKRHELVRAFGHHLEELHGEMRGRRWDAVHEGFQDANQLLEKIEHAEVRKKKERQAQGHDDYLKQRQHVREPGKKKRREHKALARFEEARQELAHARETHGPDHPKVRELTDHLEELFGSLKRSWEQALEQRKKKTLAQFGRKVKQHRRELERRHKQAMKEAELLGRRLEQLEEAKGADDPEVKDLAERRARLLEKTERELNDARQRMATALSEAEQELEERQSIETRELREKLERLRKSVRLY